MRRSERHPVCFAALFWNAPAQYGAWQNVPQFLAMWCQHSLHHSGPTGRAGDGSETGRFHGRQNGKAQHSLFARVDGICLELALFAGRERQRLTFFELEKNTGAVL